jgi:hypothetical protein
MDENFKPQIFTVLSLHGFILIMDLINCPYKIHIRQIIGFMPSALTVHAPYYIVSLVLVYFSFFLCTKNTKLMSTNFR